MKALFLGGALLLAVLPATTNYKLNSYGFGSGSVSRSQTATYSIEGGGGELAGGPSSTSNTGGKPGYTQTQQANVPKVAAFDNGSGQYYNKLHFVIDAQGNPSDAKYLVAISSDSFATTSYVQPDGTLTSTLSTANYQTYSAWGGSSGSLIIGLLPGTGYAIKLKATQGNFTESAYGPVSSTVTTASPSLTFNLVTSGQTTPPFSSTFGTLSAGSIATATTTINSSLTTNGTTGGDIYIKGQNVGLLSATTSNKIVSASADLSATTRGYGAQNSSITQTSGGPFSVSSPYNGSGNNVGILDTTLRSLYSASAPVTGGAGTLQLKAKAANTDLAATDYQDILTLTASANF